MKLSLRARAFILVATINVVVFAAGGLVLMQRARNLFEKQEGNLREEMTYLPQAALRPERGDVNVARFLAWPSWSFACSDALLVDDHGTWQADGRYQPTGVHINPVGRVLRDASFDEQRVLGAILEAMETGAEVVLEDDGGVAVPIAGEREVWGGLWFQLHSTSDWSDLVWSLVPWYLGSTILLTAATFLLLRRNVLIPVEQLVEGARRVRSGDFSTRLSEPRRSDEVAELVRSFNDMTATVQGFNERLAEEVQRATEQARQAQAAAMTRQRLAAMGQLAAGIAHEINNPLGGLQNAVEALGRDNLPAGRRERYLKLLGSGLERIRLTVGKLLRFTPRDTPPVPVDLADVAVDAVELVCHRARRAGVALWVHLPGAAPWAPGEGREPPVPAQPLPRVEGGRNELGQALLNLLVNALDAIELSGADGGRVDVRLSVQGAELSLVVEDDGPGLSAEELERAPDLFYTTKDVDRGTGLGLALVHTVVASHRGRVVLSSEAGRGLRAQLMLPLAGEGGAVRGGEER